MPAPHRELQDDEYWQRLAALSCRSGRDEVDRGRADPDKETASQSSAHLSAASRAGIFHFASRHIILRAMTHQLSNWPFDVSRCGKGVPLSEISSLDAAIC